jgi:hypothetical protein
MVTLTAPFTCWQLQYFPSCPGCPEAQPTFDADGDGQNNQAEFDSGTNPTNSASALALVSVTRETNGNFTVTWKSVAGKSYIVQSSDGNPGYNGSFTDIATNPATGSTTSFTDPIVPTNSTRYYRVRSSP